MDKNKPTSTPSLIQATGAGVTPEGATYIYFKNTGTADAKVANGFLPPGKEITANTNRKGGCLEQINYDATGTKLLIACVSPYIEPPDTNQPPTINVTSPANNASVTLGQAFTLSATAADPDGSIASVYFKVDGKIVGEIQKNIPYTITWGSRYPGKFSITAVAVDNEGKSTESSEVIVFANLPT
jgi:hypothetical protein